MDSLYAAIPIAPPASLGERNIEAFILPLVIDEVSCYPEGPDRQENRKPSRRRSMKKAMLVTLFCLLFHGYTTMIGPVIAPDGAAADEIASIQTPFPAASDQLNPFGGNLHSVQAANWNIFSP